MNTGREIKKKLESPPQWNYRERYNPGRDCLYLEIGHRIRDFTLQWLMGLTEWIPPCIGPSWTTTPVPWPDLPSPWAQKHAMCGENIFSIPHKKQIPIFRTARYR
ncbi:hypothetical protein DTO212C5_4571 [Paecilomyces variotii]|nr:hypothetical protein DTO212C5_4571 [Paecilomyces variotii]